MRFDRSMLFGAALVVVTALAPRLASAACSTWPDAPVRVVNGCNYDGVCKTKHQACTVVVETVASCPSDCGCAHDLCEDGAPLSGACTGSNAIAGEVCAMDPYCCTVWWDYQCTQEANDLGAGCT